MSTAKYDTLENVAISDVLPLKAARRDTSVNLESSGPLDITVEIGVLLSAFNFLV